MNGASAARSTGGADRAPGFGTATLAVVLGLFLGLPVVVLIVRAAFGGGLLRALGSPVVTDALVLSLVTTAISLILIVALGLPLAFVMARRRIRGAAWFETAIDVPIVLPPAVAGLALLLVFGRQGLVGQGLDAFGISIPFTTVAVIMAQVFVAAPFFIRSARVGLAAVERDLEDAARVDGASERDVTRWITLPLAAPALTAGMILCWARALGEFGATIMFAGSIQGRTQTLPLVVYAEFQGPDLEAAIAAAAILVLAAFAVLASVRALHWRRVLDVRTGA